jgi:type II secretory pathway predicted ATPase ExeA
MVHAHWGLERSPFAGEPPLFYEGESQIEALARLRFIARGGQTALLAGERGVGKSRLVRQFAAQRRREGGAVAIVNAAGLSPREMLWQAAAAWAVGPLPGDDAPRLFRRIAEYAEGARWRPSPAALLVDDADQAGPDLRSHLLRILSLGAGAWLAAVLCVGPAAYHRLGDELLERVDLQIELAPWSEPEMAGYVQHALVDAGADRPVFEDEALSAMYLLTDGLPRRVNRLAEHALLVGAAEHRETVDAALVEAAHDATSWTATA